MLKFRVVLIVALIQTISCTPLELGYNPEIRPFYAPNPIVYPQPIIRPTSGPIEGSIPDKNKKSTLNPVIKEETPTTSKENLENRFGNKNTTEIGSKKNTTTPVKDINSNIVHRAPSSDKSTNYTTSNYLISDLISTTEDDKIVFPTEHEDIIPLGDRFGTMSTKTPVKTTTVLNLNYKPTRPFYAPDPIIYPQPINTELSDRFTSKPEEPKPPKPEQKPNNPEFKPNNPEYKPNNPEYKPNNPEYKPIKPDYKPSYGVPNLSYVPNRPFYAGPPRPYPEPIYHTEKYTHKTMLEVTSEHNGPTTTPNVQFEEDNTEKTPSTKDPKVPSLEYKPSRPPFAGNFTQYPVPIEHNTDEPTTTSKVQFEEDRTEMAPSTQDSKVPSLGYKPSRPPFAGNFTQYPIPNEHNTDEHSTTSKVQFEEDKMEMAPSTEDSKVPSLGYKPSRPPFAGNFTQYPVPIEHNTEKPTTTPKVQFEEDRTEKAPTTDDSKVPSLEYKPSRPPFAGNFTQYPVPIEHNTDETSTTPKVQFEEEKAPSTENSKVPSLEYKPSRPPFAGNFTQYPIPIEHDTEESTTTPKVQFEEDGKEKAPSTEDSKVPSLEYKPSRPPIAGNFTQYPTPIEHKNKIPEEQTVPSAIPNLGYKPTRPFYAGKPQVYPQPITTQNKPEEEINSSTVPNLNYKPSRPPYAGPYPYPQPITDKPEDVTKYEETSVYPSSTPKYETTTKPNLEELSLNLQQLQEYVQGIINSNAAPEGSKQTFDVNKIAEAIKPLFTKTG